MSFILRNFLTKRRLWVWVSVFLFSDLAQLLAQRPMGADVSHYQGTINWTAVKNSGVSFAWAKSTEGLNTDDDYFVKNQTNARSAGVLIGAYHFAHPELYTGLTGADQEAAHFWSVAKNYLNGTNICMMPVLDMEASLGGANPAYTKTTLSQWANRWCQDVVRYAASNNVAVKPIIYTGISFAGTWLNSSVTNWPLWVPNWPSNPDPQNGAPTSTNTWPTWTFWQYTDSNSIPGSPTHGWDLDVYNGTAATLSNLTIGGLTIPYFIIKPTNHLAADAGSNALFSVLANGALPLRYQWRLNGTNVSDATNATIKITAALTNAGYYAVVVTNSFGSITSTPVSLTVYPVQGIMFADDFESNSATNWTLNASSSDTLATFNFNYSTLGIPSAPHSSGGSTHGLQMKANLAAKALAALSLSPTNRIFSGDYRVHFDGWINVNGPFPNGGGGSTLFLTAGLGTTGTKVEWTGAGSTADGYYFAAAGDVGFSPTDTGVNDFTAFTGTTIKAASSGVYLAGTDSTARDADNFYYQTAFFSARTAPASQQATYPQQVNALDPGTFGLAWHDVMVSRRGSTVDWVIDGIRFATISNATFNASNVFVGFWDPATSLSSNNIINFGLVDNVRVEQPAIAPGITTNPISQIVKLGTNVLFTVAATGVPPPAYRWQFNGTNISGATNSSYGLAFVDATNAGTYSVVVSNFMGSVASSNAVLAILPPNAANFQATTLLLDNTVQISFGGDAYWTYTIETSTNLISWSVYTNLTSTNELFEFNAGAVTNSPQQFFRARVGP